MVNNQSRCKQINTSSFLNAMIVLLCLFTIPTSCDLLSASLFGDEIMYTEVSTDLWDIVPELKNKTDFDLTIRRLKGSADCVGIYVSGPGIEKTIVLLDAKNLKKRKVLHVSDYSQYNPTNGKLFNQMSVQMTNGDFLLGNLYFNLINGFTGMDTNIGSIDNGNPSYFLLLDGKDHIFYTINNFSSNLSLYRFDGTILTQAPNQAITPTIPMYALIGAAYVENDGNAARLLLKSENGSASVWTFQHASFGSATTNFVKLDFIHNSETHNPPVWLTADGIITKDEKSNKMVRYNLKGDQQDSVRMDTDDRQFYFEPDGSTFYIYSRTTGILSKANTWW